MLAKPEHYKGITYIRISSLPEDQKTILQEKYNQDAVIKILKDSSMISDCLLYDDYTKLYKKFILKGEPKEKVKSAFQNLNQVEFVNK